MSSFLWRPQQSLSGRRWSGGADALVFIENQGPSVGHRCCVMTTLCKRRKYHQLWKTKSHWGINVGWNPCCNSVDCRLQNRGVLWWLLFHFRILRISDQKSQRLLFLCVNSQFLWRLSSWSSSYSERNHTSHWQFFFNASINQGLFILDLYMVCLTFLKKSLKMISFVVANGFDLTWQRVAGDVDFSSVLTLSQVATYMRCFFLLELGDPFSQRWESRTQGPGLHPQAGPHCLAPTSAPSHFAQGWVDISVCVSWLSGLKGVWLANISFLNFISRS